MGLLEELEKQAQQQRVGDDEERRLRDVREKAFRDHGEPAMVALTDFLTRLFKQVETLKTSTRRAFELPGYGTLVAQTDPDLQLRQTRNAAEFRLEINGTAQVQSEACPLVQVNSAQKVKSLTRLFQAHRLGGGQPLAKDEAGEVISASFRARGKIEMSGVIECTAASGQVRMSFSNFEGFTTVARSFAPERLDEAFFDALGRYLLCQSFDAFKESLPEDVRNQIKAQVAQMELKKRWEAKLAERQKSEYQAFARSQGALGQVRHELVSLGRNLLGLFRRGARDA